MAEIRGVVQRETLAREHPDVQLADLAARQHGVVSRQQLHAIGLNKEAIRHRVAVRRLTRVDTAVFSVGHRLTPHGRCMAGVLGSGQDAVASHASAAALLDLRRWPTGPVHVTVPRRGARSRKGVVVHETRSLESWEQSIRDQIPCTSVARTLVDHAAVATPAELRRLLEQSVRLNLFDRKALEPYHGRRGMARLTRLVTELADEPPLTRRELERLFLDLVFKARLPRPVVNARIGNHEVDFHWRDHKLVVETDGVAFHNNAIAFRRDRHRDLELELAGWHVLRFGWHDVVDDSDRVVALLRRCLLTTE